MALIRGIDWSNPLSKDLKFLTYGTTAYDFVHQINSGAIGAGVSKANALPGDVFDFSGSQGSGALSWGNVDWLNGATELTITAVFKVDTTAIANKLVAKWGNGLTFVFSCGVTGIVAFALNDGATKQAKTASVITAGKWYTVSYAWRGGAISQCVINGVAVPNATEFTSVGTLTTSPAYLQLGIANDGSPLNGMIAFAAVHKRGLSTEEMIGWHKDLYSILISPAKTLHLAAGGGTSVALTGQSITSAKGSLSATIDKALSGLSITGSSGSLGVAIDKALTGQASTLSSGTLSAAISIALTGQSVTASYGVLGVAGAVVVALSGLGITSSIGNLGVSVNKALTGTSVTSSGGTLSPVTEILIALTGLSSTVSHGSLGVTIAKALTGQGITITPGTLHVLGANIGADTITTRFEGVSKTAGGSGTGGVGGATVSRITYTVTEYIDGTADVVEEIVVGSGDVSIKEYEYIIN